MVGVTDSDSGYYKFSVGVLVTSNTIERTMGKNKHSVRVLLNYKY